VSPEFIKQARLISSTECNLCKRCAMYCPFGIDVAYLMLVVRRICHLLGVTPRYIQDTAHSHSVNMNQMWVKEDEWPDTLQWQEDEARGEISNLRIPLEKEGAEIMYSVIGPEPKFQAQLIYQAAVIMNVAGLELRGSAMRVNPTRDVNETTAIVLDTKLRKKKTGVVLVGGGSQKNFTLQTEPQIQEVLRIKEFGQDYFLQVTDARPDTGGLSGATPSEAVSWGKVDPDRLPDAVVCYTDTTIAMPILTHYALANHKRRKPKKLYRRLPAMTERLAQEYWKHNRTL
jgi:hypothetical protein